VIFERIAIRTSSNASKQSAAPVNVMPNILVIVYSKRCIMTHYVVLEL